MTSLHHHVDYRLFDLADILTRYAEAGIDPTFDTEMDELERQFAEYRLCTASE